MLEVRYLNSFKSDYKKIKKRGYDLSKLKTVLSLLIEEKPLPEKYQDHQLIGKKYKGCRECHISPDWLLVYKILKNELILELLYTGTHSDLF